MQGPLQGYSDRLPQRVPMKGTKPHALLHVELASFTCLSKATLLLSRAGSVGPRVAASNSNFRIGPPDESVWLQLRELLGYTGSDPGHWNFSPEWWGSQDGGWGHNEGITIFNKQSVRCLLWCACMYVQILMHGIIVDVSLLSVLLCLCDY
jgi:hypothetical protein